jgi:hypothetical protein
MVPDDVFSEEEDFDPEQAERDIAAFIASAEALAGPPVAELAARVLDVVRVAWSDIEAVMADVAHNKLLATMLDVSRRARTLTPDDPAQWQASAASSILSGLVGLRRPD